VILFFDTETTGKTDFKLPATHPSQPSIVQLGAQLYDNNLRLCHEINLLVKPEFKEIEQQAADIHGIQHSYASDHGVSLLFALSCFLELQSKCKTRVAHNLAFDSMLIEAACSRLGLKESLPHSGFCTMQAMTPVMRLPGNYGKYKWPKLSEAYEFCTGQTLEGAHDALADVRACKEIYKWLNSRETIQRGEATPESTLALA